MPKFDATYTDAMDMLVLTTVGLIEFDRPRQRTMIGLLRKLVQSCLELAVDEDEDEDEELLTKRIDKDESGHLQDALRYLGHSLEAHGPTGGSLGTKKGIPLKEQGWLGNIWWADGPTKIVTCRACGTTATIPIKWPDSWLCHNCNPDIRQ